MSWDEDGAPHTKAVISAPSITAMIITNPNSEGPPLSHSRAKNARMRSLAQHCEQVQDDRDQNEQTEQCDELRRLSFVFITQPAHSDPRSDAGYLSGRDFRLFPPATALTNSEPYRDVCGRPNPTGSSGKILWLFVRGRVLSAPR